jgi:hypothetical protein
MVMMVAIIHLMATVFASIVCCIGHHDKHHDMEGFRHTFLGVRRSVRSLTCMRDAGLVVMESAEGLGGF